MLLRINETVRNAQVLVHLLAETAMGEKPLSNIFKKSIAVGSHKDLSQKGETLSVLRLIFLKSY